MPKAGKRAPHERSVGAQMERRAIRAYLRRELKGHMGAVHSPIVLERILDWVLIRQKRFDARPGGLGR